MIVKVTRWQAARGFTFGILIAGVAAAALFASSVVSRSLAPLEAVSAPLVRR